jgi:hypothetical protein
MNLSDLFFWTDCRNRVGFKNIGGDELAALLAASGLVGYTQNCRVRRTSNQTLTTGGAANVIYESVDFDTDNMADLVADDDRITIRTAGKYMVGAGIEWNNNSAGGNVRIMSLRKNPGGAIAVQKDLRATGTFPLGSYPQTVATMQAFDVGDEILVQVQQDSGGNLDIQDDQEAAIILWAARVG